ncbi:HEPN domain-containing protein [Streptomyces griseoviridis]|uniref:Apea-like HEPN domain-containing protein n=1 Tax=Streptomyces griseoviridis TaxID=45398 RepID=A0ABT9LFE0_STRGD|nr:HEPN domain-containing protein [Streptomyces griseoviridis]MDP9682425.1 hypothetical protein [Streptomyces griseoviridis]GGS81544.1 hypothetical protein GCM10010240_13600 [Streptomyces griseoviridis]
MAIETSPGPHVDRTLWDYIQPPTFDAIAKIGKYTQELAAGLINAVDAVDKEGYKALFSTPSLDHHLAAFYRHQNLAGLNELYQKVQSVPSAAQKFLLPADREEEPLDLGKVMLHEVAMIPILLADMYVAKTGTTERVEIDTLEQLYLKLETYLLTDDLKMEVFVPILGAEVTDEATFDTFSIIRLSEEQRKLLSDTPHVAPRDAHKLSSVTHALRLENVPALAGGCGSHFEVEPYESTFDMVDRFFEAVSLESQSVAGCAQMIFSPSGWFGNMDAVGNTSTTYLFRDYPTRLDALTRHTSYLDYGALARVHEHFGKLSQGHPSLRVAARRLNRAWIRDDDEDRIVDLCIGLEALLGGGSGSGEIVHKISMRAGAILSQLGWGRSGEILSAVKDVYSYRSRVVHGVPGPHKKQLLHLDGMPIHASRYALAALRAVLLVALHVEGFHPDKVDAMFVYSALDMAADQLQARDASTNSV